MAKKPTTDTTAPTSAEPIDPAAYYDVKAMRRFRAAGVGFGPQARTQCTGAILQRVLESEHADKVAGYTKV